MRNFLTISVIDYRIDSLEDIDAAMWDGENGKWITIDDVADEVAQLEAELEEINGYLDYERSVVAKQKKELQQTQDEVARLRKELNLVTDGRWTQTEIDAGKWRGQELKKALEAGK
jgi:hypothetical protein